MAFDADALHVDPIIHAMCETTGEGELECACAVAYLTDDLMQSYALIHWDEADYDCEDDHGELRELCWATAVLLLTKGVIDVRALVRLSEAEHTNAFAR